MSTPTRLRRAEASSYLREAHGMQVAVQTLARWACEGGGPRFYKGSAPWPLYPTTELDAWAQARLGKLVGSTTEAQARTAA